MDINLTVHRDPGMPGSVPQKAVESGKTADNNVMDEFCAYCGFGLNESTAYHYIQMGYENCPECKRKLSPIT